MDTIIDTIHRLKTRALTLGYPAVTCWLSPDLKDEMVAEVNARCAAVGGVRDVSIVTMIDGLEIRIGKALTGRRILVGKEGDNRSVDERVPGPMSHVSAAAVEKCIAPLQQAIADLAARAAIPRISVPMTARDRYALQADPTPEPWRPSVDDWDLLPDA